MIKIVGLGPGSKESLTIGALEALKDTQHIFFRTDKHPTIDYINQLGINFETYDYKYEQAKNFDEVYEFIANDLTKKHEKYHDVVYAVPGHPLVAEKSVAILNKLCTEKGIETSIIPAVSFIDAIMESLKIDPVEGIKIIDAFDIKKQILDKRVGFIITQVYNKYIASEVKLRLLEYYDDETEIYFVRAAGVKESESIRKIHLYELDRQEDIDYLTTIYVPKDLDNTKDFSDLIGIMDILRGEDGCPWDKEQTHETLRKCLIEECYEVIEAIDEKDDDKLSEELGDVLLQVVFHSKLGEEDGYFNINDVIKGICNKMIERHPHIFGDLKVSNTDEVLDNWEKIKKKEQGLKTYTDTLKHVPKELPALMKSIKVQEKAAKVGFDWENIEPAMEKILEEYYEVKNVYKSKNKGIITEEIGDLIFACVNVARFLDIDPEYALNYTIDKFISRFQYIEQRAIEQGLKLQQMTLKEMDNLWNEAKKQKK
ncbi:nucleoside triphosphate pyrophosphohydrolase [Haloimpatiens sp. FM7330]|uniref:nucleoside triphosphate pyrophosphohydrolase n=1 Tax=Haloimpatiens sp. FM7330 TaxID=3298610 RepID=UPI003644C8D4